jgi:hypothetical protein
MIFLFLFNCESRDVAFIFYLFQHSSTPFALFINKLGILVSMAKLNLQGKKRQGITSKPCNKVTVVKIELMLLIPLVSYAHVILVIEELTTDLESS